MSRSKESLEFQTLWLETRQGEELVPARAALRPATFKKFLPTMAIAEIDMKAGTMPIQLAGTAIRDFVGFELTGLDFLEFDQNASEGEAWRTKYHDHPCGRYEELCVTFREDLIVDCALTVLPLLGKVVDGKQRRLLVVLFEPTQTAHSILNSNPALVTNMPTASEFIDIGKGVPNI